MVVWKLWFEGNGVFLGCSKSIVCRFEIVKWVDVNVMNEKGDVEFVGLNNKEKLEFNVFFIFVL